MRKILMCTAFVAFLGGVTFTLLADSPGAATKPSLTGPELSAKVAELKAMPKAERHAALKAMDPASRRGLWFAVRKAVQAERGPTPAGKGQAERRSISVSPSHLDRAAAVHTKGMGTIQYDAGMPSVVFGNTDIRGNRFNTHTGLPVFASGSVDTVQAVVIQGPMFASNSAGFVLLGPQTTMGGAMALFSTFTSGLTGTTATVTFAALGVGYTGSEFFVLFGDFNTVYDPAYGTGTTMGQGHHGVNGLTGGMGPNIVSTSTFGGTLNAFIRATGNIVPVELTSFRVD